MKIEAMLTRIVKENASDGFISAEAPPSIKVDGQIFPITDRPLSEEEARALVLSTMSEAQQKEFIEVDFSIRGVMPIGAYNGAVMRWKRPNFFRGSTKAITNPFSSDPSIGDSFLSYCYIENRQEE